MAISMAGSNSSSTSLSMETDSISSSGKRPLKEGSVQMTSLSTLLSFHRYFFLYHDTLIVSKQKGLCSFKLKDKLRLSQLWVASANNSDSFLIGWPIANYLVHFRTREEKDEWFELMSYCVQQSLKPVYTTISMDINVRGRKQVIRRRIENGRKSGELVVETANDLGLPITGYELKLTVGDNSGKTLQGPENVYAVIMHEIESSGLRLSESQRQSLDTCPIANARLVLSNMKASKTPSPMNIMNSIKRRVLHRGDSRGLLGRELDGASPPQTIMTIVDHLRMKATDNEGIFRKSPKQSTFKELRTELERGVVPDYNKYSTHVLASMLKEYLRSIPGKILQSGNYELWMKEVVDETDLEKKLSSARSLIGLLPSSHCILLSNVLRLLSQISASPSSKMTAAALSVCVGPGFIESPDQMEGGKKIPLLVEFLILNAASVVPGFNSDNTFSIASQSVDLNANLVYSPEPASSDDGSSQRTPIIEEIGDDSLSLCSLAESTSLHSAEVRPDDRTNDILPYPIIDRCLDGPLSFSSDEDDESADTADTADTQRESFLSNTLQSIRSDVSTLVKDKTKDDKCAPVVKAEERKEPRSPCLKRIHFQRTEAQLRGQQHMFKKESRAEVDKDRKRREDLVSPSPSMEIPRRKESKEEATQTETGETDLGKPTVDRFPPFKSTASGFEQIAEVAPSPRLSRRELPLEAVVPMKMQPRTEDTVRTQQRHDEKPTVEVHPFNQEPTLQSISERLAVIRDRNCSEERPESPRYIRKSTSSCSGPPPSWDPQRDSPRPLRRCPIGEREMTSYHRSSGIFETSKKPTNNLRKDIYTGCGLDHAELYPAHEIEEYKVTPTKSPLVRQDAIRTEPPVLITERFPPYCIEPNEYVPGKRTELQRSSSQRGEKSPATMQRELQRAASVKVVPLVRRGDCVGMDPLEINWSVRQLKRIFQDTRAPAIDTDYNCPY